MLMLEFEIYSFLHIFFNININFYILQLSGKKNNCFLVLFSHPKNVLKKYSTRKRILLSGRFSAFVNFCWKRDKCEQIYCCIRNLLSSVKFAKFYIVSQTCMAVAQFQIIKLFSSEPFKAKLVEIFIEWDPLKI